MLVTFEAGKGTEIYGHRTEKAEDIKQLRDMLDGKFIDMVDGRYFSITERSYKDIIRNISYIREQALGKTVQGDTRCVEIDWTKDYCTTLIQEHTHEWYGGIETDGRAHCRCGAELSSDEVFDILNGKID